MLAGLTQRRSIRSFSPQQITQEELYAVLQAGMYAPTARGKQSPVIVVIQKPEEIQAVAGLNRLFTYMPDPYYSAPTILIVLVPKEAPWGMLDGAAVLTNLCNGAYAAGLGSCWINRPQFMFETQEGKNMLKRWGLTGHWVGVGSVALGYANGAPPEPLPRKKDYCIFV